MNQATNRQPPAPQQGRSDSRDSEATEPLAVDRERLIWDPEYRRAITRLLRKSSPQRS